VQLSNFKDIKQTVLSIQDLETTKQTEMWRNYSMTI